MREGNFNRVERAERVEKGLGVSSQELESGEVITHAKSAKFAKSDVGNVLTQRHKGTESWPMVKLGDVCAISRGRVMSKQYLAKHQGQYPVYSSQTKNDGVFGYIDTYDFDGEYLTWTTDGANAGSVFYHNGKFSVTNVCGLLRVVNDSVWTKWLLYCLRFCAKSYVNKSLGNPKLMSNVVSRIEIKVPPLSVQKEIVERLEKELGEADKVSAEFKRMAELADKEFKAELDETFVVLREKGAGVSSQELGLAATTFAKATVVKKDAKSAKPWPMVRLGDVCKNVSRLKTIEDSIISYIDISSIDRDKKIVIGTKEYERSEAPGRAQQVVVNGDVLVSTVRPNLNAVAIVEGVSKYQRIASTGFCVIRSQENILPYYVYYFVQSKRCIVELVTYSEKASYPSVTDSIVKNVQIPLPSLSVQNEIVSKLDAAKERCEKLKVEAVRGLRAAENLRKAILSEAFELN